MNSCKYLLMKVLLTILISTSGIAASGQKRIEWVHSDYVEYDQINFGKIRRAIGSVEFRHQGTTLFCDSAYFYEESNVVEAYSNVHIQDSDTLNLYSDFLLYQPENNLARASSNVVLVDPQMSLTTDSLIYNLKDNVAYYPNGGKIVSRTNTLTSRKGTYYADRKLFIFEKDVVLIHPKFTLYTDTLHYFTQTEVAFVYGPTLIRGEENLIYTERGWYDTRKDVASFWEKSWIQNKDSKLSGDSMFYDRNISYATAYRNVQILDTVSKVLFGGHFGEYDEAAGYSYLTDSAWADVWDKGDTLFLRSDTLHITFDSLRNGKVFTGYDHVRFYRQDLQGACDSIAYHFADSLMIMFQAPVIWNEKTQITADTITLYFSEEKLDSIQMVHDGFIISDDRPGKYNQVRGEIITGEFEGREIRKLFVQGKTETVYFVRDEDGLLIGIDKARSDKMRIEFRDGDVESIIYYSNITGTTSPEKDLGEEERYLKGFKLRTDERPESRFDLEPRL
jgi:lipopolysaccharide export system protein LptA